MAAVQREGDRPVRIAAAALSASFADAAVVPEITLFDMGGRGVSGRSSHRRVRVSDSAVLPDDEAHANNDEPLMEFDHGAQFFKAHSPEMKRLADHWVEQGWAAEWRGKFGRVSTGASPSVDPANLDFFGCPGASEPLFVGVGGMQSVCRRVLVCDAPGVTVRKGVRVAQVERLDGAWRLHGTSGRAALHDSPESEAALVSSSSLDDETFDDVSSSFGAWHRASAGLTEENGCPAAPIAARVGSRPRVPLFTVMVAFRKPKGESGGLPLDAFTVTDSNELWFAARQEAKPRFPADQGAEGDELECWTLISTAAYAVAEISETTMQDEKTGAFVPQDPAYLNGPNGPSMTIVRAFRRAAVALRQPQDAVEASKGSQPQDAVEASKGSANEFDEADGYSDIVYLQGQRWGSALAQPLHLFTEHGDGTGPGSSTVRIMNVEYDPSPGGFVTPSSQISKEGTAVLSRADAAEKPGPYLCEEAANGLEFEHDADLGFFYAGDFASRMPGRSPGIEAAALSGIAAASQMAVLLLKAQSSRTQEVV
eukprot:CAMPEP_0115161434 /NCGR_PEP_ID=MMETSP0227-20121206/71337_1 /TAXON_ID=89957 /ORGANISM="Polarella glacialis, Strain CCMP 1383" /LENGTH=538 /DNA_ID=CAMNT_0002573399 /DNA_START=50 /DNA_END=1667 /DNA_ORIENTATION=-